MRTSKDKQTDIQVARKVLKTKEEQTPNTKVAVGTLSSRHGMIWVVTCPPHDRSEVRRRLQKPTPRRMNPYWQRQHNDMFRGWSE